MKALLPISHEVMICQLFQTKSAEFFVKFTVLVQCSGNRMKEEI